jgi:phosphopantothenoylcysteine synthetase/decarboxylase
VHNTIAHSYDAIVVYPASVAFLSTLASGSGNTPFSLAILGTRAPVVIAPSFPPGVLANPIVHGQLERIAAVPNYHLVKPHKGKSRSIDAETDVCAPLWDVIATLEAVWPAETDRVPAMTSVEKG